MKSAVKRHHTVNYDAGQDAKTVHGQDLDLQYQCAIVLNINCSV